MMRLTGALLGLALTALAATGWMLNRARADLSDAQRVIGTLSAGIESRDRAITRLQSAAQESSKREAELRLLQGRAGSAALEREYKIQRETYANETLRGWSDAALPADVIRLHARPAFTSARDYLDWVSARDKLPDTRQSAPHPGRSGR